MQFCVLNEEEFNKFVSKEETNNFFQSIYMYHRLNSIKKECYLVGVKNSRQEIIGASLLSVSHTFLGKKVFDAPKGFILNYDNYDLLEFFTTEALKFIKEHNGFRLTIDPYILNKTRDIDGNEVIGGVNNEHIKKFLETLGYTYLGERAQVKWTFVLDINSQTSQELFTNFKSTTRNQINKTINKFELNVRELKYEELYEFKKITEDTCERRSFADRSLKYYEEMHKNFKDKIKVLIAELDCAKYLKNLDKNINNLTKMISTSSGGRLTELTNELTEENKRMEEILKLKAEKGNIIPLSGAMFITYGKEIVYLFSGSYNEYAKFYGQYRLQWEMIKYATEHKYRRYNFYGIKNFTDKNNKDYGIYTFKRGFNGHVEELLGSFEIGIGFRYKIYQMLKKLQKATNILQNKTLS